MVLAQDRHPDRGGLIRGFYPRSGGWPSLATSSRRRAFVSRCSLRRSCKSPERSASGAPLSSAPGLRASRYERSHVSRRPAARAAASRMSLEASWSSPLRRSGSEGSPSPEEPPDPVVRLNAARCRGSGPGELLRAFVQRRPLHQMSATPAVSTSATTPEISTARMRWLSIAGASPSSMLSSLAATVPRGDEVLPPRLET